MLTLLLHLVCYTIAAAIFSRVVDAYASKPQQGPGSFVLRQLRAPILLSILLVAGYDLLGALLPAETFADLFLALKLLGILVGVYISLTLLRAFQIFYERSGLPMKNIVPSISLAGKLLVGICAFLLALNLLHINLTAILGGLGVGGIIVGLALQETMKNFFAGVYLASEKFIREGDFVRLENGQEGYVEKIGWRSVRIRSLTGDLIVVSNSKLVESAVINYSLPTPETACLVNVGVAYGSDLEKVERVTVEVAEQVMKKVVGEIDFKPFIRFGSFGEHAITLTVVMRVKEPTQKYLLTHEFIKELHKRYREEGIEIPFPTRTIYTKQA
jgi:small-conductance mechanosensitive channel